MASYITELSKYIIMTIMILYTFCCFYTFQFRDERQCRFVLVTQNLLMFALQGVCFVHLALVSGDIQYVFFYGFVQIFLLAMLLLVCLIYPDSNRQLLNNMAMLIGIGLMMISRLGFNSAVKQFVILVISLIISLLIPFFFVRIRFFKKATWIYAAIGIVLLGIVLIAANVTHGANISITIQGITFQPSEFVKIIFVFFMAAALWKDTSLKRVAITTLLAAIHVLILVASTDLGGALIFFVAYLLILFVASQNYLYLLAGCAGGSAAAVIAYKVFSHVRIRVLAWQDPWSYIDNYGYQITQSLFAITSGSWFGMGLMKGDPTSIPYVMADFIFSSICEEMGVVSGVCLVLICLNCFLTMIRIALRIHDKFYQLVVYGIASMYIFQIFLTIGGGTKFIPLTGVTLPFISYGGSSVMTTMIMFFIIQSIYIRLQQQEGGQHGRAER